MAARTGMANLIAQLRGMTAAGSADFTAAGVSWWTDDQLQVVLDQHRRDIDVSLTPVLEYDAGGTPRYYDFLVGWGNLEGSASGAIAWNLYDSAGVQFGGTYTPDFVRGLIRFAADTGGSPYYLRARSFNLYRAAADVWQQKAGQATALFSIDPNLYRAWVSDCNQQATAFLRLAGISVGSFQRNDLISRGDADSW